MADRMLFIGWDTVVRGREERAIEVFNESVGLYGRMQQEGRIESLDVVLMPGNGSGLQGYFELHGSAEQLAKVRDSEDFLATMTDASLIVDQLRIIEAYTNQGVAERMAAYREAVAKVPQLQ
jgi:hypothetical protein